MLFFVLGFSGLLLASFGFIWCLTHLISSRDIAFVFPFGLLVIAIWLLFFFLFETLSDQEDKSALRTPGRNIILSAMLTAICTLLIGASIITRFGGIQKVLTNKVPNTPAMSEIMIPTEKIADKATYSFVSSGESQKQSRKSEGGNDGSLDPHSDISSTAPPSPAIQPPLKKLAPSPDTQLSTSRKKEIAAAKSKQQQAEKQSNARMSNQSSEQRVGPSEYPRTYLEDGTPIPRDGERIFVQYPGK